MKNLIKILILTCILSCQDKEKLTKFLEKNTDDKQKKIDTLYFNFLGKNGLNLQSLNSLLLKKSRKVIEFNNNYKLTKQGIIKKGSSKLLSAIKEKPELCYSSKNCYKIKNLEELSKSIHKINFLRIDDTNDNENDLLLKLDIEELIFYSSDDAKTLFSYINHVRNIEYFWNTIDKTSNNIFIESNKLYYVRMRNNRSNNFVQLIADLLKE